MALAGELVQIIRRRKDGGTLVILALCLFGYEALSGYLTRPEIHKSVDEICSGTHIQHYRITNPGPGDVSDLNVVLDFPRDIDRDKFKVRACRGLAEEPNNANPKSLVLSPRTSGKKCPPGRILTFTLMDKSNPHNLPYKERDVGLSWSHGESGLQGKDYESNLFWLWAKRHGIPILLLVFGIIFLLRKPKLDRRIRQVLNKLENAYNSLTDASREIAKDSLRDNISEAKTLLDQFTASHRQE